MWGILTGTFTQFWLQGRLITDPFNPVLKQFCAVRVADRQKNPVMAKESLNKADLIAG
jgi:hypothetical protein